MGILSIFLKKGPPPLIFWKIICYVGCSLPCESRCLGWNKNWKRHLLKQAWCSLSSLKIKIFDCVLPENTHTSRGRNFFKDPPPHWKLLSFQFLGLCDTHTLIPYTCAGTWISSENIQFVHWKNFHSILFYKNVFFNVLCWDLPYKVRYIKLGCFWKKSVFPFVFSLCLDNGSWINYSNISPTEWKKKKGNLDYPKIKEKSWGEKYNKLLQNQEK